MTDYAAQRLNMVESQVRANDVTNARVIAALRDVPRERFLPNAKRAFAYAEASVAVSPQRYIMEPRTFAKLLQLAAIAPTDSVLDVGCATGYSAAVLARLAAKVAALEEDADLVRVASDGLAAIGARNATVVQGALSRGFTSGAPFDVIVIEGAVEAVPDTILNQLADGGRLVAVIQKGPQGRGTLFQRERGRIGSRPDFDASIPGLPGFREPVGFVF